MTNTGAKGLTNKDGNNQSNKYSDRQETERKSALTQKNIIYKDDIKGYNWFCKKYKKMSNYRNQQTLTWKVVHGAFGPAGRRTLRIFLLSNTGHILVIKKNTGYRFSYRLKYHIIIPPKRNVVGHIFKQKFNYNQSLMSRTQCKLLPTYATIHGYWSIWLLFNAQMKGRTYPICTVHLLYNQ